MKLTKTNRWTNCAIALFALCLISPYCFAQALQQELEDLEVGDLWMYGELEQGIARARETGKPLFVLFR